MDERATPAVRLLNVFDSMRDIDERVDFRELWAKTLNHEVQSQNETRNMAEVATLLRNVEKAVSTAALTASHIEESALLGSYTLWGEAVFGWQNMEAARIHSRELIPQHARDALASVHGALGSTIPEPTFDAAERDSLLEVAYDCLGEVLVNLQGSEQPDHIVRARVVPSIIEAHAAISYVRFRGDAAVHQAVWGADVALNFEVRNADRQVPWLDNLVAQSEKVAALYGNLSRSIIPATAGIAFVLGADPSQAAIALALSSPDVQRALTSALPEAIKALPQKTGTDE